MIGQSSPAAPCGGGSKLLVHHLAWRHATLRAQTNEELMASSASSSARSRSCRARWTRSPARPKPLPKRRTRPGSRRRPRASRPRPRRKRRRRSSEAAPDLQVKWAPGPTFSSKDGSWSVHVRGRLFRPMAARSATTTTSTRTTMGSSCAPRASASRAISRRLELQVRDRLRLGRRRRQGRLHRV